ncbi:hypothetical protein Hypma_002287 [Hypsizygus marmoreus]|uniref:Uncharacterized protein n=1 Tax=Hypsizygus marmoreus TaxID=39966 RepID=A0A369K573_HYPMA|nr:hypothetical protein Hypma_002287 [Hypsizygus marmoreus]
MLLTFAIPSSRPSPSAYALQPPRHYAVNHIRSGYLLESMTFHALSVPTPWKSITTRVPLTPGRHCRSILDETSEQ